MMFAKRKSIIIADKITVLGEILSEPVALLGFIFLIILLICSSVDKGIIVSVC